MVQLCKLHQFFNNFRLSSQPKPRKCLQPKLTAFEGYVLSSFYNDLTLSSILEGIKPL